MGALNSQPITDKEVENGEVLGRRYGVGAMQGWRRGMEDAHVATSCTIEGRELALFGVFDGHGGKGVALCLF